MPFYTWKGINSAGKTKKGLLDAASPDILKQSLLEQNIALLSHRKTRSLSITPLFSQSISIKHLCAFFENLALMIESGVDLISCLQTLSTIPSLSPMRQTIDSLIENVQHGHSLSSAMQKSSPVFSAFTIHLVAAGERTGKLASILNELTTYLLDQYYLQKKIRQAAFAPLLTLAVSLVIIMGIFVFILPQFQTLYESVDQTLPVTTQLILNISSILRSWYVLVIMFACITLVLLLKKFVLARLKHYLDTAIIMYGPANSMTTLKERISLLQTLALFLSSGLQLTDALDQAHNSTQTIHIKTKIAGIINALHEGRSVSHAFRTAGKPLIDEQLIALVHVGEQAGSLDKIFAKAASMCQEKLNTRIHRLTTVLPPLMMIFVGLIIGILMIVIYQPIFKMGSLFKM